MGTKHSVEEEPQSQTSGTGTGNSSSYGSATTGHAPTNHNHAQPTNEATFTSSSTSPPRPPIPARTLPDTEALPATTVTRQPTTTIPIGESSAVRPPGQITKPLPTRSSLQSQAMQDFLHSLILSAQIPANALRVPVQHIATLKERLASIQEVTKRHEQQRLETAERLRLELGDVIMQPALIDGEPVMDPCDAIIDAHRRKRTRVDDTGLDSSMDHDDTHPAASSTTDAMWSAACDGVLPMSPYPEEIGFGMSIDPTTLPPSDDTPSPFSAVAPFTPINQGPVSHQQLYNNDSDMNPVQSPAAAPSPTLNPIRTDVASEPPRVSPSSVAPQPPQSSPYSFSSTSRDSSAITLRGPQVMSTVDMSSVFLRNYLNSNVLGQVDRNYAAGHISSDAVNQYVMMLATDLEPDDQDELLGQFSRMNLDSKDKSIIATKYTTVDPIPATPYTTYTTSTSSTTKFRSDLPTFGDDLSFPEASPDDPDGVARMRIIMLFSSPTTSPKPPPERKRKKTHTPPPSDGTIAAERTAIHDQRMVTDSKSLVSPSPSPASTSIVIHRMVQVNRAYERLLGYSQAECGQMHHRLGQRHIFAMMRSDHLAAAHKVIVGLRLNRTLESVMYLVLLHKSGREIYCLTHFRSVDELGVFMQGVQSLMPLPDDPLRPPPPFVPGVDLSVETLMYGYQPPHVSLA